MEKKKYLRNRKGIVAVLGIVVAGCVTGALTMPAITMNRRSCGLDEHQHEAGCYEERRVLACSAESLGIHQHTEDCQDENGNYICGYADFVLHSHDGLCFDGEGNLICQFTELEEHQHDESCYTTGEDIVVDPGHKHTEQCYAQIREETPDCGIPESGGHRHDDSCYTIEEKTTCDREETGGHTHDASCYDENNDLICQLAETEGHTHDASCRSEVKTLTCKLPEAEGHIHTDSCYRVTRGELICGETEREPVAKPGEKVLTCDKPELTAHVHGEECYRTEKNPEGGEEKRLTCPLTVLESHTHSDSCFETVQVLTCTKQEHTHDDTCVAEASPEELVAEVTALIDALPAPETVEAQMAALKAAEATEVTETTAAAEATEATEATQTTEAAETTEATETVETTEATAATERTETTAAETGEATEPDGGVEAPAEWLEAQKAQVTDAARRFDALTAEQKDAVTNGEKLAALRVLFFGEPPAGTTPETVPETTAETVPAEPVTLTHTDERFAVTVTWGPEAKLPAGAALSVSEYDAEDDILLERYMQAAELYGWEEGAFHGFALYDISLTAEGGKVQPAAPVEVTISLPDMDEPAAYHVTHYGEEGAEDIAAVCAYEDGTQTVSFTASGFSDYSVAAVEAEGISLAAAPTDIDPVSGYEDDKGTHNFWKNISQNVLDSCTKLTFGGIKANGDGGDWGNGIRSNTYTDSKIGEVRFFVVDLSVDDQRTLDEGGTVTLTNQGYIRIENTGTVGGKSVDTIVRFDQVTFSGCFKEQHIKAYGITDKLEAAVVKPHNNRVCVAAIKNSNQLWLGMNYCNDLGARVRYNDTYTYPCNETLDVTIEIVEHKTDNLMNTQFLQVASDIDVWRNGSAWEYKNGAGEIDDSYRGRYAETVTTLDGFNSTFYCYPGNWNNITENAAGKVSVAATPRTVTNDGAVTDTGEPHSGGVGGTNSYTLTGIYGETQRSTWKMRYTEGWCSTEVEIYIPSWPVTIKKVDADNQTNALSGAKFILSRVENRKTLFRTMSNTWDQDRENAAQYVTADKTGTIQIDDLHPGDYTLTEVEAPPGYQCLGDVNFNLSVGGVVTSNNPMVTVDDNNSLLLTVQNKAGSELPETGGMGTSLFFIAGSVMALGAAMALTGRGRRRGR